MILKLATSILNECFLYNKIRVNINQFPTKTKGKRINLLPSIKCKIGINYSIINFVVL